MLFNYLKKSLSVNVEWQSIREIHLVPVLLRFIFEFYEDEKKPQYYWVKQLW